MKFSYLGESVCTERFTEMLDEVPWRLVPEKAGDLPRKRYICCGTRSRRSGLKGALGSILEE